MGMKRIINLLLSASISIVIIISCTPQDPKTQLQNEIEKRIKNEMNDPESYEFKSFYIDSLEWFSSKEMLKSAQKKYERLIAMNQKDSVQIALKNLIFQQIYFRRITPYKYSGTFSFRGNNKFGAKILAEYRIHADSLYNLIYIIDNEGDTVYRNFGQIKFKR